MVCLENTLEDRKKSDTWKVGKSYLNQANVQKMRMNKVLCARSYWNELLSLLCTVLKMLYLPTLKLIPL